MAAIDYYNTNDDNILNFGRTIKQLAQTFTASQNYDIGSVKVKIFDNGAGSEDDITVAIKATAAGLPTGGDLATGTIAQGDVPTGSPGSFTECILDSSISLTNGTVYAIVLRCDSGTGASDRFSWRSDATSPTYGNGQACQSVNTGSSWSALSTFDMMFETYESGEATASGYMSPNSKFWG